MTNINYTFGVLSNGEDSPRNSTISPNDEQKKYLHPLWKKSINNGNLAELLIRFLRCSEHWPKYCASYDKNNTYHIPVELEDAGISFKDLVDWADSCSYVSNDFRVGKARTAVDRVANRLFGVLTIK